MDKGIIDRHGIYDLINVSLILQLADENQFYRVTVTEDRMSRKPDPGFL